MLKEWLPRRPVPLANQSKHVGRVRVATSLRSRSSSRRRGGAPPSEAPVGPLTPQPALRARQNSSLPPSNQPTMSAAHPDSDPEHTHILPAHLIKHLNAVLVDLHTHPYPYVPCPPDVPKRASVALVIRVSPNYTHWPPPRPAPGTQADEHSSHPLSTPERIRAFFSQEWVQHGEPEVLFIKRAARKGDKWTSHVAFPGGRRDPEDADDRAAAVRETWEEVGLELSDQQAIATGNLPQRVVTSSWGSKAYPTDAPSYALMKLADDGRRLMTLCPYVFLLTSHDVPPLKLQPTEVASTHWVPLRALLSRKQRTYWYQDVAPLAKAKLFGLNRYVQRSLLGDMMFAAVKLVPSESRFCTSIAEFLDEEPVQHEEDTTNQTVALGLSPDNWRTVKADAPLLLWGLTLGVMGDFLDMLPPHNALKIWTYPTFTALDTRFLLWLLSYSFRKRKQKELGEGSISVPGVDDKFEAIQAEALAPVEGRVEGVGGGRYYGRVRQDKKGSRSSAVGTLLTGYYDFVRTAVIASAVWRLSVTSIAAYYLWRRLRRGRA
jgi:8-oxo-dGTP pyrophosphatase MutT (NUDIX family)